MTRKLQRTAVKDDRANRGHKSDSKFYDRYRASIPRRVGGFVERVTQDRAQLYHDLFKVKFVDGGTLDIPETITFPDDNHTHQPPSSKFHRDINGRTLSNTKVMEENTTDKETVTGGLR